ncbi:hypothetical protein PGT21_030558 [Puccinia graminis f. sp. tritici]|uniref:Uncharacterized protein n=1 Tax=Puccinia graminis f. sp. tritici TaxID=56615 RepID=A0A5B0PV24_PUCGR|nr:hypothetical protein PGTUg99_007733 [Puccinia graminis f. sp. tritici]KAA1104723.1 hypothetical protein PGT21_030558 [Puccinia graminis f. sp. tritici]
MDCRRIFTFMGGLAVCVAMKDFFHQIHGEISRERPGDLTDGTGVFRTSIARIDDEDPIHKFRELQNAGKELQLSPLNQDIIINIPPDQRKSENHQVHVNSCSVSSLPPTWGSQGLNSHLQGVGKINRDISYHTKSEIHMIKRPKISEPPAVYNYYEVLAAKYPRYDGPQENLVQISETQNQPNVKTESGYSSQKLRNLGSLSTSHEEKEVKKEKNSEFSQEVVELRIPKLETSHGVIYKNPDQSIKVEEGIKWLEFDTSLFWNTGTDSINVKSITELLKIDPSSPPKKIELTFEQAGDLLDDIISTSVKYKSKLRTKERKNGATKILNQSTKILLSNQELWLEYWQKKSNTNLKDVIHRRYNKLKKMRDGFLLFLFYVDMIDTIILPQSPIQSKFENKSSILKLAVEKYNEYRMSYELKREEAAFQGRIFSKKFDIPIQPTVWHVLDFWIVNSGRIELIKLRESEKSSRSQAFKRFFNTLFRLSIGPFTKKLKEIQNLST